VINNLPIAGELGFRFLLAFFFRIKASAWLRQATPKLGGELWVGSPAGRSVRLLSWGSLRQACFAPVRLGWLGHKRDSAAAFQSEVAALAVQWMRKVSDRDARRLAAGRKRGQ
jgi:hypothetical protein